MCGIAGIWSLNGSFVDQGEMSRMLAVQNHRGPEDAAYCHLDSDSLLMGFLKLAFTDKALGMQPLYNEDGSIAIVYNGEIYDYELQRTELINKGHVFTTQSDSEVLIHLYEEYGKDFVHQLNGEFSFAIFDKNKNEIFLARDPFGINPLCYTFFNDHFIFSSEAKGILAVSNFPRKLSKEYLNSMGVGIPCASYTLFEGIENLLPGHVMTVSKNKHEIYQYWNPKFEKSKDTFDEAKSKVRFLVEQGVKRRLDGDPPLALLLSSGLDSTIIAAVTKSTGFPTESFSMGFKGQFFDEGQDAQKISSQLGLKNTVSEISTKDLISNFTKSLWHTETPTTSLTNTGRFLTYKLVRDTGFKAVMGGESSDEIFGGYPFFALEYLWDLESKGEEIPSDRYNNFRKEERLSERVFWDIPKGRKRLKSPYGSVHIAHVRTRSAHKRTKLLLSKNYLVPNTDFAEKLFLNEMNPEKFERLEAFDKSRMIARNIAASIVFPSLGDRLEMGCSLEGRIPFLDKDLVEYVYTLPADYFIDKNTLTRKKILRAAFASDLPPDYSSPAKHTFLSPRFKDAYRLKEGQKLINSYLNLKRLKEDGVLNPRTIKWMKLIWMTNIMSKERSLFIDSVIGLALSLQILHELFIKNDPIARVELDKFKMTKKIHQSN